jgi:hypothetical protein
VYIFSLPKTKLHSTLTDVSTPHESVDFSATLRNMIMKKPISTWDFENNGIDSVGSNDLTDSGTPVYSAVTYKLGSYAFSGNATANYLYHGTLLDTIRTDYGGAIGTGISLEMWVRFNDVTTAGLYFFDKTNTTNDHIRAIISAANTARFSMGTNAEGQVLLTTTVAINTWYHFVFIIKANGDCYLYKNGVLVASDTATLSNIMNNGTTGNFCIGSDGSGHEIDGFVDALSLFGYCLPDSYIWKLYDRATATW